LSTSQSQETGIAFREPQTHQFFRIAENPRRPGRDLTPKVMDRASPGMLNRVREQFSLTGIDTGLDEFQELKVLEEFLMHHIQVNGIYDVQCMLLWSEWIRNFRRRTTGFPKLFRENEFSSIIMNNYGVEIATHSSSRGAVYSGIRYIP
jgi:hypothetical protein